MRRIISVIIYLTMALILCSCSSQSADTPLVNSDMEISGSTRVDEPVNPLIGVDFDGCEIYIERASDYEGLTEPILMDEEETAEFIACIESADIDETPTVLDEPITIPFCAYYTIILPNGTVYELELCGGYCVVGGSMYAMDTDSFNALFSYYKAVYIHDYAVYEISELEYNHSMGYIDDEEYEAQKQNLVDVGLLESLEEYNDILATIDDISLYVNNKE